MSQSGTVLHTIGHSTRPIETLLALLADHEIEALVDVRRFPASRRHPQFQREALAGSLRQAGIDYRWLPELGGRRVPRKDSHNTAWRNAGFCGYADYMETDAFRLAIDSLLDMASGRRTAFMCAEHAWQQCHRGLIADHLKAGGHDVVHLLGEGRTQPHPWSAAAKLFDGKLSYAGTDQEDSQLRLPL